jgi:hypothetical protein
MAKPRTVVVFVHGWSVTNTDTYGGLPARLRNEAKARGMDLTIKQIFLGRYISFHDEVRVKDISRAFRTAVEDELTRLLADGTRFVCITHSTGGPVIRDWWHRYYYSRPRSGTCPMSHLIMLAPANFGSALAQLGKGKIGRLKSWAGGVEPGQGVLDWLELGSAPGWELNEAWIRSDGSQIGAKGIFPFVLTGQAIDRKFYDNLNTYTGESGSDGVVRVAAANMNARLIHLKQQPPKRKAGTRDGFEAPLLELHEFKEAPETALRVVSERSHSGDAMGIMKSVKPAVSSRKGLDTVEAIIDCLSVRTKSQYNAVMKKHRERTAAIQEAERCETEERIILRDVHFIHDRYSMIVFRVRDDHGHPVTDYDLLLTAGKKGDPNLLPRGFFVDRQRNKVNPETITYFVNYDVMVGAPEVQDDEGGIIRPRSNGAEALGFELRPRPSKGFVHYVDCSIQASPELLTQALEPNSTTLIDIELRRIVRKNVFRMNRMVGDSTKRKFKDEVPGDDIVD